MEEIADNFTEQPDIKMSQSRRYVERWENKDSIHIRLYIWEGIKSDIFIFNLFCFNITFDRYSCSRSSSVF